MVELSESVKTLGIILDQNLKFYQRTAKAATNGHDAAIRLKGLNGLRTKQARQLFASTVVSIVDSPSSLWATALNANDTRLLK